jgi:hypothetical protein
MEYEALHRILENELSQTDDVYVPKGKDRGRYIAEAISSIRDATMDNKKMRHCVKASLMVILSSCCATGCINVNPVVVGRPTSSSLPQNSVCEKGLEIVRVISEQQVFLLGHLSGEALARLALAILKPPQRALP